MREQAVLKNLFRTQAVPAVDQRHIRAMIGEIKRFFNCRVAAADDGDLFAAIEKPVTGRASRNALALQRRFALKAEPPGLSTRRDDDSVRHINISAVACQAEGPLRKIDICDDVPHHLRANMFCLRLHFFHEPRALDDTAKAGIVFNIRRDGQLSTWLQALHDNRLHSGARRINSGRQSGGARPHDEHACGDGFRHVLNPNFA